MICPDRELLSQIATFSEIDFRVLNQRIFGCNILMLTPAMYVHTALERQGSSRL